MTSPQELLTTEEAAAYLRSFPRTLEHWRQHGQGPNYSRLGRRVVYAREDLDNFIAESREATRRVTDVEPENPVAGGGDAP